VAQGLVTLLREMEVDCRRLQVEVTEQNLDRFQIGSAFQKVRRPTMTQCVWRYLFLDARTPGSLPHGIPHRFRIDRLFRECFRG
jgi:hypothetical protein